MKFSWRPARRERSGDSPSQRRVDRTFRRRGSNVRAVLRRILAAVSFAGLLFSFGSGLCSTEARSRERPNIVFILTDEHRWDFMSCAGHPFLETPNMDRLAAEGILFHNAFVTTSLCSPSRASFLTGQYAHTHGVKNNFTPWQGSHRTFLEILHEAGYDTAFIGKWHMPGRLPQLKGVDPFITFTIQGGQGRYLNCPLIVNGNEKPSRKRYITEELTDYAIEFIEREREKPFCLVLAHKAVHHRWIPPAHLAGLYEDRRPPFPDGFNPWIAVTRGQIYNGSNHGSVQSIYRDYCRSLVAADEQLGRLLNRLDDLRVADRTFVLYAGDNGFFWGEHNRFSTGRWAYEESIRIPFVVRYPGCVPDAGRRADQMVLNIDVAPTFLEVAGIPVPGTMEGTSFVPVLRSADAAGRRAFLYEYFRDFPYRVPPMRAVRTESHTYVEYEGRRKPEFYDLESDPRQQNNLMNTAEGKAKAAPLRDMLRTLEGVGSS